MAKYKLHVAGSHTDLTSRCRCRRAPAPRRQPHLYVHTAHPATPADFLWSSRAGSGGDGERLYIRHTDANFCVFCTYYVTVAAAAGTRSR